MSFRQQVIELEKRLIREGIDYGIAHGMTPRQIAESIGISYQGFRNKIRRYGMEMPATHNAQARYLSRCPTCHQIIPWTGQLRKKG